MSNENGSGNKMLAPGTKVIIIYNPHQYGAENIVGTALAPSKNHDSKWGKDFTAIRYKNPIAEEIFVHPFLPHSYIVATPENLKKLAEQHEAIAKQARSAAKTLENKNRKEKEAKKNANSRKV